MPLKKELIYIDGKDETDRVASYTNNGDKCILIFKNKNKEYSYNRNRLKIVKSAICEDKANNIFNYLKKIADIVGLKTEEGDNILAKSYQFISFVAEDCILANYLNGTNFSVTNDCKSIEIFPFGFNNSQKDAVNQAFSNSMSVIEDPPGTGKTQTILNIIANAVMSGQSVAVVSSNNSATKNVYEKLEKNGMDFIAALLGNSQNKKDFIDSQTDIPDLSEFKLSDIAKAKIKEDAQTLCIKLTEYLSKKNELALVKQELINIKIEYQHFQNTYKVQIDKSFKFRQTISADKLLALWLSIENLAKKRKKIGFINRIILRLKYGIKDNSFYTYSLNEMIFFCQSEYYSALIFELTLNENALETLLTNFSFESKMKEYTKLSMKLFKAALQKKYDSKKRKIYALHELRSNSSEFIKDYPVIMSTTYSLRQSLSENISYDYIIIDESSQVDLATGALALLCAKRAVIVGDLKQLPNVVDSVMQVQTDFVFESFNLPEPYRYSNHSLLSSITELYPNVPKTLLREHYRCHPRIIEFCNKKFYNNQLIALTEHSSTRQPLIIYKTAPGNHARGRSNQRQIDMIEHEIILKEQLEKVDLGIVTPYRDQTNDLQKTFYGTKIKVDTVDKFQGRENKVIILSTVDNEISDFTDNENRLNVAVSRAIEQLILVVNGNDSEKDSNIADLIRYIEYNNFSVVQSDLNSIFDRLYKGYEKERERIILKAGKVSEFDSENLMYALIKDVLSSNNFLKYGVCLHFPVKLLIKNFSKLNKLEQKYVNNPLTHLDFLIYNKLDKFPVLAIEVDGVANHKDGTRQAERDRMKDEILEKYGLPFLRFPTNGSNEKDKLIKKLNEIQKN
ncbi:MAG: AAA domain-containing protein [Bacteroidia bacterium]